ncbi:hypothetical protein HZB03_02110 [Candidatus Woesearchaeota archaeon]|nr:hypothetical protein [Candidatus Woesearchaeota archaeon]
MSTVYLIEHGCPICSRDLKGNDELRYFCRNCNILFEHKDIYVSPEEYHKPNKVKIESTTQPITIDITPGAESNLPSRDEKTISLFPEKKPLSEDFDEEKALREVHNILEEENVEEKELKEEPRFKAEPAEAETEPLEDDPAATTGFELEGEEKIIASKESTKLHAGNCRFISKIQHDNRIYFASAAEGKLKGYELCVCLRRINALNRP